MSDTVPLAEIRERVARYQANPNSVDASADMAACCDSDLATVLAQHDALLDALAALEQQMRVPIVVKSGVQEGLETPMLDAQTRQLVTEYWANQLQALRTAHGGTA